MNKALSICFAVVAAVLLVTGYTALARYKVEHERAVAARIDARITFRQLEGKPLSGDDHLEGFDEVADKGERRTVELIGTVQSCAGWIVFGLAAVLWCLPTAKKV